MTKLERLIKAHEVVGWVVFASDIKGIASYARQSNTGKQLVKCFEMYPDYEVKLIMGAKNRYKSEGTNNAIMYRPLEKEGLENE